MTCAYGTRLEGAHRLSGRYLHTAAALSVSMAPLIPLERADGAIDTLEIRRKPG
jgi:hypothetical protein